MIRGKSDFSGGIVLSERVSAEAPAVMRRISGYRMDEGRLVPEGLVARLSGGPLEMGAGWQVPFSYIRDGKARMIARDSQGAVHIYDSGEWMVTGDFVDMPADSAPCRFGKSVIFPCYDGLYAYEPDSPTVRLRPLGMRSPADYAAANALTPTPSTFGGVSLFDCEDSEPWEAVPGKGCSVDNTPTDAAYLTVSSTTPVSTKCFTKSLGGGVPLADKKYLVLDLVADGQAQDYSQHIGYFGNDPGLQPSGYALGMYSDTACTSLIAYYHIPSLMPLSRVNRVVIHLGELTWTCKGIAICTATFFHPPASGSTNQLTVYSGDFVDSWAYRGNVLHGAATFAASPMAELLPPVGQGGTGEGGTSAIVLHTFTQALDDFQPGLPKMRWVWCLCGRDTLGELRYEWMVSNPSDASAELLCDPWRAYTLAITLPVKGTKTALIDYGDYLKYALVYRAIYDGATAVWGDYLYIGAVAAAVSMSLTDSGEVEADTLLAEGVVPSPLEITNDFPSSARFVTTSQGRLWAACLDWDPVLRRWRRPTAIEVSSWGKPWAFPTTVDQDSLVTDGSELDGYAQTGAEVRAMLACNNEVFVWLDNEFGVWQGESPVTGYRFTRLDSKGCAHAASAADCRGFLAWDAGDDFYAYAGGLSRPISKAHFDRSLVDWNKPHGTVYAGDRYLLACTYDGEPSLAAFDLSPGGWRVRRSPALRLVGICPGEEAGEVWGVQESGYAVSLFGGNQDFGASGPLREVETQFWLLSSPEAEVQVAEVLVEAIATKQANLTLAVDTQGVANDGVNDRVTVRPGQVRYKWPVSLKGDAARILIACAEVEPPTFYFLGLDMDQAVAR